MFERFSEAARLAMFGARLEVTETASDAIEPEHLLLGLLEAKAGIAEALTGAAGLTAGGIRPRLLSAAATPLAASIEVPFAPATKAALQAAVTEADDMTCAEITTGHLLLGLMRDEHQSISILLHEAGLEPNALRSAVQAHAAEGSEAKAPALEDVFEERIRRLGLWWGALRWECPRRGEAVPLPDQATHVTIQAPTHKYERDVL